MARVPTAQLSLVPEQQPQSTGLPSMRIDTPLAAFGGATAEATSKLGATLGHVGDELFARAQALQQLKNETDAKDEDIKFMITAGEMHAQYNSLQGNERVAAYPKYAENLQNLYRIHRQTLGNDQARQFFDRAAVSTVSRSLFNGAGAAATAQKEAMQSSINSEWTLKQKQAFDNPDDDPLTPDEIEKIKHSAALKAGAESGGNVPERAALLAAEQISLKAYNRILSVARTQPYKASQMLDDYKAKGYLLQPHFLAVEQKVGALTESVGTDIISRGVMDKYRTPDGFTKSAKEMRDEAVVEAQKAYPNNPKITTSTQAVFDRDYNQENWIRAQEKKEVSSQLNDYIVKGTTQVEQLPRDLVNRMSPEQIKQYPATANAYNRSIDTQTNKAAYDNLLGMYNNDNAKFMEQSLLQYPGLSKDNINFFLKLQRQSNANGDPRVSRAMGWLRGARPVQLAELGIDKKGDTQNRFVGSLHQAIQAWQEERGKPPNEKEVVEQIFPTLSMQVVDPDKWGFGLFNRKSEMFAAGIPPAVREAAEKDAKAMGQPVPNDEDIRRMYLLGRFKQLYTKPKDQSRVPIR